jgi:hypothetical protein
MTKTQNLVEIKLRNNEDFRKIRETLTRIGVASRKEKVLYQSCHILHKQGQYYLVHFKELFILDGKPSNFSEEDMARRNTIANLMHEWELLDIVNHQQTEYPTAPISQIKIIPYKEKDDWELVAKYNIGKKY